MRKVFGFALMAALAFAVPVHAATPVQGTAAGGAYYTIKVDKRGHIVGAFVADDTSWYKQVSLTDNTATSLKAAVATTKNCITWLDVEGIATTTAVTATFKEDATTIAVVNVPAGASQRYIGLPSPICNAVINKALTVTLSGSPTGAVQVNAGGYTTP